MSLPRHSAKRLGFSTDRPHTGIPAVRDHAPHAAATGIESPTRPISPPLKGGGWDEVHVVLGHGWGSTSRRGVISKIYCSYFFTKFFLRNIPGGGAGYREDCVQKFLPKNFCQK